MRQRIYEMWIAGYKVANIAADFGVNDHTVKSELERGYKRTYPERGIHPPMQSLAGASPARGLHFQKTQPPHAETMVCGGGCGLFLGAVAEGDFFFGPAGFTAVGVFTVSTADIIPTVGAVFLFSPCNCIRLTAYSTNVRRADAAAQRLYIPSDSRRNKRMCSGHSPFSQRCKVRSGTR